MTLNTRTRNFLKAIAGKRDVPDPESPMETVLKEIAERLNMQLLPVPADGDIGKVPVVKADKTYEFSDAPFEFPEVTNADNGKTMLVKSGVWVMDSDYLIIHFTYNESTQQWSSDKTYLEAHGAHAAGKEIVFEWNGNFTIATKITLSNGYAFVGNFIVPKNVNGLNGFALKMIQLFQHVFQEPLPAAYGIIAIDTEYMEAEKIVAVTEANPVISPGKNCCYECDLTSPVESLVISDPDETGHWRIVFGSGVVPTTTTIPATILGLEDFAAEEGMIYEIDVLDNRAKVGSWAIPEDEEEE